MAIHSSTLAWRIPWTGEPGRLPSMGSQRVGHHWSDLAYTHTLIQIHVCTTRSLRCGFQIPIFLSGMERVVGVDESQGPGKGFRMGGSRKITQHLGS